VCVGCQNVSCVLHGIVCVFAYLTTCGSDTLHTGRAQVCAGRQKIMFIFLHGTHVFYMVGMCRVSECLIYFTWYVCIFSHPTHLCTAQERRKGNKDLPVHIDMQRGVRVEGLTELGVDSTANVLDIIELAQVCRM